MMARVYINLATLRPNHTVRKGQGHGVPRTPLKVFATHLLLTNSKVKGLVRGKGVEVETSEKVVEAIRLLKEYKGRMTWRKLVDWHLLPNPTPEQVIRALSLDVVL